ncbi:Tyrosine recombinase XerC [Capillimicrobium parvum]|uniref:Tyrosine recombinase XerC n=1 Tax=Capillimicrobium parvum TaxID=2884022 RepID=A0A9E6XYS3_9ACTN|nr:Tyrosine recombinase XerC [Capillimicrobium parvum]
MAESGRRITGNLRIEERPRAGRVWVATYVRADGTKGRKFLGPAWVKDSGKRTPRGAVVWRAANGSKPDPDYLTPREAQDALDRLLGVEKAKPRTGARSGAKTLGAAADAWLLHGQTVRGVSASTMHGYTAIVGRLYAEEFSPDTPLRKITEEQARRYQDRLLLDGKLGRESIRRRLVVLRRILQHAKKLGWIGENSLAELQVVSQPPPDPDFNVLEPSQVEAVARAIAAVPDDELPLMRNGLVDERAFAATTERRAMWADVVRVAAYTGLRFGELRALRWRDVNFSGESIVVRRNAPTSAPGGTAPKAPKSGKGRSVPLIPQAIAALDRLSEAGYPTGPDDLVFPTRGEGMLDAGRVRNAFYRGLRDAGLGHLRDKTNPMTFHDLRHTFGTIAVRVFPVSDVQAMLGHADIQTTMRYVHSVPRTDAAKRLAMAFSEDLGTAPLQLPT